MARRFETGSREIEWLITAPVCIDPPSTGALRMHPGHNVRELARDSVDLARRKAGSRTSRFAAARPSSPTCWNADP